MGACDKATANQTESITPLECITNAVRREDGNGTLRQVSSPAVPTWLRVAVLALSAALIVTSLAVIVREGRFPASVPADAPPYALADLLSALGHVGADGRVDVEALANDRAALDRFVAAMAKTSPLTTPDDFPTVEARIAFWLNASHALLLRELADHPTAKTTGDLPWSTFPIGGRRLGRDAILRRFLQPTGDGRLWLALADGSVSGPPLDTAPFGADTLDRQLDEAARRFLRRRDAFQLAPPIARLTPRLTEHLDDFLAALPPGRTGVLQVVWAYLPDGCEGLRPGCDTRADLDRACGADFSKCQLEVLPVSDALAIDK